MRLNKTLKNFVRLARFAGEHNLDPLDVAELVQLAIIAFKAGERATGVPNSGDKELQAALRFEIKADHMGFGVVWSGLWPTLTRSGAQLHEIHLPGID